MKQLRHIKENTSLEQLFDRFLIEMNAKEMNTDRDFEETPFRVAKYWREVWHTQEQIHAELQRNFNVVFPSDKSQMVVVTGIKCHSICPHHLVPISYVNDFGYIPDGEELGLSKIARVLDEYSHQPLRQEMYTTDMVNLFDMHVKNKGIILLTRGVHGCMVSRGVEQLSSATTTSDCTGKFLKDPMVRKEFYDIVRMSK